MGKPSDEWQYGNIDEGFARAALVLEDTFVTQAMSHHSMEPRSALAYWQHGKLYLHGSTQSTAYVVPGIAKLLGIEPSQLVFIAEYCGGGFGSKAAGYPQWGIPALLAKKTQRPVLPRQPGRRVQLWQSPRRLPGLDQNGLPQRWPHHGGGHVCRA